ncbi:hypothetical protein C1H46_037822 [Malus baccata]|uniref:Uncharacterized protein n=1 Tax=Malus baccata TaxID=106549 RepID=A0A540KRK2_MALBA|nr:hypothetical protein C1H46_037822 [Malus baccata]
MQLSLNGSRSSASVPSSTFLGSNLKKVNSRFTSSKVSSGSLRIVAEVEEERQTNKDKWRGLAFDTSNDQQDITRGKGMVDSLFQAPQGAGTHFAIMSSYEYISMGLRQYNFDNNMDGFYIAPALWTSLLFTSPRTS